MSFVTLKAAASALRDKLEADVGRSVVSPLSLEEPTEPLDELFFLKLTAWCYGLLIEAAPAALRHLHGLLKITNKDGAKDFGLVRQAVVTLRTVQSHNLIKSKEDENKRRQAEIWMLRSAGSNRDFGLACNVLMDDVERALCLLLNAWSKATEEGEDKQQALSQLVLAIDNAWPAHHFDSMLDEAAIEIGIKGLDIAVYRNKRLERWQDLVACFHSPEEAREGLRRAIRAELVMVFGSA